MLRQALVNRCDSKDTGFRWRGGEVSRLEGFSDAVFGFAITLLVVSLEVPNTFEDLANTMRGFGAFAVCFCLLSFVWYDHYVYFRQYGLSDIPTVVLNLILLFVVMFYVYPLKFLFTVLVTMFTGMRGQNALNIQQHQFPDLLIIYGAGFVSVYTVFSLMYLNAYRQRNKLNLDKLELFDTKAALGSCMVLVAIGVVSIVLATFRSPRMSFASGVMYWMIGPAMGIYWTISGMRRNRIERRITSLA